MNRSPVRALIVIFIVVVVFAGGGGALVWWKLASLKERLQTQLGQSIGAQVQVGSISLDVWKRELHASGITLVNERTEQPWEKGDISQATLHFHLRELFSRDLQMSVEVESWNLKLHSPLRTAETPPSAASPSEPAVVDPTEPPGEGRIRVTQISARKGTVEVDCSDDRKVIVQGVSFEASDNGAGVWTTQLRTTSLTAGTLVTGPGSAEIRGEPDKMIFSDLHLQAGQGAITGDGDAALHGTHDLHSNIKLADVPMTMLVAVKWQMQLSGLVTGDLTYQGNDQGGEARGQIAVNHGKFNVLPLLGKVTALVGLSDISNVEVDKASTDVAWKDGALHLTNIDVRKTDVVRVAGGVDVNPSGQIDGHLKLGLPSSAMAKWPQLQTQVFPVALEDYNWTEVHLTGTADHLEEDLTPRLVSAGMSQGGDLLNSAAQKATDLFHSLMGK